ncbi:MAG TPA: hypothetical protein PKM41_09580 [Deltaproteobacteria bacterium]|nr:hypothetical protein [Deltaproteobacteria bacterium]HOI07730.1 hypothetical protein [Deltaproteobacteria bacterium]
MFENRRRAVIVVVSIVIPFLAGFVLSWYIWGRGGDKPVDYKQVLQETISYIGTLEEKNKALTGRVDSLDAELAVLRQKGQQTGSQSASTITALNQKVGALEAENQKLKGQIQSMAHEANTTCVP